MDRENVCLHNTHGYFVGRWIMGRILRLSVEYFSSENTCLEAIKSKRWTRRLVLQ